MSSIIITGGAGFIGAHLVKYLFDACHDDLVVIDKLSYAGHLGRLGELLHHPRLHFYHADVTNAAAMARIVQRHRPWAVMHLAAESHVDRSIDAPEVFMHNNVQGTLSLLQACLQYWQNLPADLQDAFRYLQVSTDEVFGDAFDNAYIATETSPYRPSSPYSASKAAADHWVNCYQRTFGLPTLITYCSNNYGPHQFAEKLIPLAIKCIQAERAMPVYGDGAQQRDWLYVLDHARALWLVLTQAPTAQHYVIASGQTISNLHLLQLLYAEVQTQLQRPVRHMALEFVTDRAGHDRCYALNPHKIHQQLGWQAQTALTDGLRLTVAQALNCPLWQQDKD